MKKLLIFLLFSFHSYSQEKIEKILFEIDNIKKENFLSYKNSLLTYSKRNKEISTILLIKEKEFDGNLLARFDLLVKTVEDKNNYSDYTLAWSNYHLSCFLSNNKLYEEALNRNKLSYLYAKKAKMVDIVYYSLMNFAGIYFAKKNYKKSFYYYKQCLTLKSKEAKASNYNNLALCEKKQHNYFSAIDYFKKGLATIGIPKNKAEEEVFYLIKGNLGSTFCDLGMIDSAATNIYSELEYYKKRKIHSPNYIYCLADVVSLKKQLNEDFSIELQTIIQEIFNIEEIEGKAKIISNLELSFFPHLSKSELKKIENSLFPIHKEYFQFYVDQQLKISKILLKDKINALKKSTQLERNQFNLEKRNNQYKSILLFVALFLIIIMLYFMLKIQKQRKIQMTNEALISKQKEELYEAEQLILQNELDQQQQQLQALSINLKIKAETEELFLQKIKSIKKKKTVDIDSIINEIQLGIHNLKEIDRKLFISSTESSVSNQLLVKQLKQIHPNLSENEINFCQFCCIDLSSKEISQITGQTEGAVRVYKNKVKNKLALNKSEDLNNYLKRISKLEC